MEIRSNSYIHYYKLIKLLLDKALIRPRINFHIDTYMSCRLR